MILVGLIFPTERALGQHNSNATVLSTELSTGEGSGPFTALGQAAAANLFSGDANFSVPIQVPPGRGEVTPSLSLSYSSSGGDGPLGFGWGLALGEITRSTRGGVPTCVEDHEFTLSIPGATVELVQHTSFPSTYYAKVDEAYIEATVDEASNQWVVHDRAGRTYRFGNDPSARAWTGQDEFMDEAECDFTALWALTQIEDPNGNTIDFLYTNTGNAPLIDEIQYGANPSAGLAEHPFKIEFQASGLTQRTYPQVSYRLGVRQVFSELIGQITVRYRPSQGNPYQFDRSYVLTYTETPHGGRALLDEVTATALPLRTFTYVGSSVGFSHVETRPSPFTDDSLLVSKGYQSNSVFRLENAVLDMNGDGIADAVEVASSSAWNVYLGNGTRFDGQPISWNVTNLPSSDTIRETKEESGRNNTLVDTRDINGDGVPDWIEATATGWMVYAGSCTSSTECGFGTGVSWSAPSPKIGIVELTSDGSKIERALMDLNGDAYPDYVDTDLSVHVHRRVNKAEHAASYPGARAVICVGTRVLRGEGVPNPQRKSLKNMSKNIDKGFPHEHEKAEAYKAKLRRMIAEANDPSVVCTTHMQHSDAFARAYYAEQKGTKIGLEGPYVFVDSRLLEKPEALGTSLASTALPKVDVLGQAIEFLKIESASQPQ